MPHKLDPLTSQTMKYILLAPTRRVARDIKNFQMGICRDNDDRERTAGVPHRSNTVLPSDLPMC